MKVHPTNLYWSDYDSVHSSLVFFHSFVRSTRTHVYTKTHVHLFRESPSSSSWTFPELGPRTKDTNSWSILRSYRTHLPSSRSLPHLFQSNTLRPEYVVIFPKPKMEHTVVMSLTQFLMTVLLTTNFSEPHHTPVKRLFLSRPPLSGSPTDAWVPIRLSPTLVT